MSDNVEKEITAIIAEISGIDEDEMSSDTKLADDLDIDSIKSIEIVVAIEKKYKISIRDEDIPGITTVKQVIDLTKELIKQKNKALL
jgi:acyl carrier protein